MTPEQNKAEAVAWRWRPLGGTVWVVWNMEPKPGENLAEDAVVEIEPLYAHPSSRDDVLEAAARIADAKADKENEAWLESAMSDLTAGARSFAAGEIAAAIRAAKGGGRHEL